MKPTDLLIRMLEIYSPSGREREISTFLKDVLTDLGFSNVHVNEVGNVYGEVGTGSPSILLCGHMDTVPGWIPVKIEDGKVYGRGSVDAKSALAAMISAANLLKDSLELDGRIIVAGVVGEEKDAKGIYRLLQERMEVDYAIFGEPSGAGNITFAYKGRVEFKISLTTMSGHVGAYPMHYNAVEKAYELWMDLKRALNRSSPNGIFYSVTPCLTSMFGYSSTRSIPDKCLFTVDVRLPPTKRCSDIISETIRVTEKFRRSSEEVNVNLQVIDAVEPFVADRETIIMKALKKAIKEILHVTPKLIRKTGTGDMNIFGSERKVPVATYGPGNSRLSHTMNEHISIEEYEKSIMVYRRALEEAISEHHRQKSR